MVVRLAGQRTLWSGLTWRELPLYGRNGALEEGESQQAEKPTGRHHCLSKNVKMSDQAVNRHFTLLSLLHSLHSISSVSECPAVHKSRDPSHSGISRSHRCQGKARNRHSPPVFRVSANEQRHRFDWRGNRAIRTPERLDGSQSEEDKWRRVVLVAPSCRKFVKVNLCHVWCIPEREGERHSNSVERERWLCRTSGGRRNFLFK